MKLLSNLSKAWANIRRKAWVSVISEGGNSKNGYSLEMDWNKLFIVDLAKNGIEGDTEEEMVNIWFQRLRRAVDFDLYQEEILKEAEIAGKENKE